ncbi:MAG TPA: non-canonical purine NTP pyrophosphatase [Acidobacteriaceae bacterium]|jgi:XTP/dITP diphosphohydrolase
MTIYAATGNAGKLREFAESASAEDVEVLALPGLANMPEPVEDANTFMGNAELKAVAYSKLAPGLIVFADDSGLEVDALGGQPGVRSARFANDLGFDAESGSGKDERNNRCLLALMDALPRTREGESNRTARFLCALALARDGEVLLRADGSVEGEILAAPRGDDGFGYDPLFLIPSLGLTVAELPPGQKWSVSHRGNAFRSLLEKVRAWRAAGKS